MRKGERVCAKCSFYLHWILFYNFCHVKMTYFPSPWAYIFCCRVAPSRIIGCHCLPDTRGLVHAVAGAPVARPLRAAVCSGVLVDFAAPLLQAGHLPRIGIRATRKTKKDKKKKKVRKHVCRWLKSVTLASMASSSQYAH